MEEYIMPKFIDKQGANPGAAQPKSSYVDVISVRDILSFPSLDVNTATYKGNIVLKPGTYPIRMYNTVSKQKAGMETAGDADSKGIKLSVSASYPGYNKEIAAYTLNKLGDPSILLLHNPITKECKVAGSIGAPLYSNTTGTDDNEQETLVFDFTSEMNSQLPYLFYEGEIPAPVAVTLVAGATSIDVSSGKTFQLTPGASDQAVIATITGGSHGDFITILGAGGATASKVDAAASILLAEGASWVGSDDTCLTLMAFDKGSGSIVWIEQSRK